MDGVVCENISVIINTTNNKQLKNITITLHDLTAQTTADYQWDGSSLTIYVLNGHNYYLSAQKLDGYEPVVDSLTYLAKAASTRTIQMLYVSSTEEEYGVRFSRTSSDPVCERIKIKNGVVTYGDATQLVANIGTKSEMKNNSFDDIYPWSDIRIVTDNDNKLHANQIMVKIPKYYVKTTIDDNYETWMISKYHKDGYILPKMFRRADGTEADYYEIARYETS